MASGGPGGSGSAELPLQRLADNPAAPSQLPQDAEGQPRSASAAPPQPAASGRPQASRSLYVGKLHPSVTEAMLADIFETLGHIQEVKIIRDKLTSLSAGYGFVTYFDSRCAALALQSIDRRILFGQEVRVNWASQRDTRPDTSNHFHIFVGDLAAEVDDNMLLTAAAACGGCSDARVVWDLTTGRSKGYGFCSFYTKQDAENAMEKLSGAMVGSRAVRCGWAAHKKDSMQTIDYQTVDRADPLNANVYIGSISPEVADEELQAALEQFGPLLDLRIFRRNCYGFAQFEQHSSAVMAIVELNGQQMGGKVLRLSWGRHQARAAAAATAAMAATPMMTAAAAAAAASGLYGMQPLPAGMVACQPPAMMHPYLGNRMMLPAAMNPLPSRGGMYAAGPASPQMYGSGVSPQYSPNVGQGYLAALPQYVSAAAVGSAYGPASPSRRAGGPGGQAPYLGPSILNQSAAALAAAAAAQQRQYGAMYGVQSAMLAGGSGGGRIDSRQRGSAAGSPADIAALGASLTGMQLGSQPQAFGAPSMPMMQQQALAGQLDPAAYMGYGAAAVPQWPQAEGHWPGPDDPAGDHGQ